MAIKMRVLYYPQKAKLVDAAEIIKAEYELSVNATDTIPPAYSCNNERIVILALSVGKDADDTLRRFLLELTKARAQNVAIIADAKDDGITNIKKYLTTAGANIVGDVFRVNTGLFAGKKLNDEEKAGLIEWAKGITSSI